MLNYKFRCSSIGKLMTEPKTLKEGPLSVGAKTYIRTLAAQEIYGVDFVISGKPLEKGNIVEPDSLHLLNDVRGLSLVKNEERRSDDFITGECDLFDVARKRGHDLKSSWSLATFPAFEIDCKDSLYEWQMRGYMRLWGAEEWEVNYCMVDTPEKLIGFEPLQLHVVSHIPANQRVTTWRITRDADKEAAMVEKIKAAREYMDECFREFDKSHNGMQEAAKVIAAIQSAPTPSLSPEQIDF